MMQNMRMSLFEIEDADDETNESFEGILDDIHPFLQYGE